MNPPGGENRPAGEEGSVERRRRRPRRDRRSEYPAGSRSRSRKRSRAHKAALSPDQAGPRRGGGPDPFEADSPDQAPFGRGNNGRRKVFQTKGD